MTTSELKPTRSPSGADAPLEALSAAEEAFDCDAGLLLVHGAGAHPRMTTFYDLLDPTIKRLDASKQLIQVKPFQFGDKEEPGGLFDALLVKYSRLPFPRGTQPPEHQVEKLVAVEGRWENIFVQPGQRAMSSWFGRNAVRTSLGMLLYHLRAGGGPWCLAILALFATGIAYADNDPSWLAPALIASAFAVAFGFALFDLLHSQRASVRMQPDTCSTVPGFRVSGEVQKTEQLVRIIPVAVTLMIYRVQRALMIVAALLVLLLLPLIAVLLRLISGIPFLAGISYNVLAKAERALMGGALGDVGVIASNYIAASVVHARVRRGLLEIESRMKHGGHVAVLGYSAGATPAWNVLSEPDIHDPARVRQKLRYSLLTVGSQLNWAKHGYQSEATPLSQPLVNCDARPREEIFHEKTLWINAYGTWDPPAQGPVDWRQWRTAAQRDDWEPPWRTLHAGDSAADPNLALNNLGCPLSAEHSEYYRNQHEFIPALLDALGIRNWSIGNTWGAQRRIWCNIRLAILAPLVRTRLIVLGAPIALIALAMRDALASIGDSANEAATAFIEHYDQWFFLDRIGFITEYRWLQYTVVIVPMFLIAYSLVELYTNFFWQSMGRSVEPVRPSEDAGALATTVVRRRGEDGVVREYEEPVETWWPVWHRKLRSRVLLTWGPTLLFPLLLVPFLFRPSILPWEFVVAIAAANAVVAVLEVAWLNLCLRALSDPYLMMEAESATGAIAKDDGTDPDRNRPIKPGALPVGADVGAEMAARLAVGDEPETSGVGAQP
jgi:hypothetical protein